jgi:hypothetical protein
VATPYNYLTISDLRSDVHSPQPPPCLLFDRVGMRSSRQINWRTRSLSGESLRGSSANRPVASIVNSESMARKTPPSAAQSPREPLLSRLRYHPIFLDRPKPNGQQCPPIVLPAFGRFRHLGPCSLVTYASDVPVVSFNKPHISDRRWRAPIPRSTP